MTPKRGRKPKETPVSEKERRNLENQRAFRQRKEIRLQTLERENEALRAQLLGHSQGLAQPEHSQIEALQQRILALETQLALAKRAGIFIDLNSSFGPNAVVTCQACAAEKLKMLACFGQLRELEGLVLQLQNDNQSLKDENVELKALVEGGNNTGYRAIESLDPFGFTSNDMDWLMNPQIPMSTTPSSSNSVPCTSTETSHPESAVPSAIELFGPLETQSTRIALKLIPSLSSSKLVDALMDMYERAMQCTNKNEIKRYNVRLMGTRGKLLDECNSIVDRQKAVELIVLHLQRNKKHVQYRNSMFQESSTPTPPTPYTPKDTDVLPAQGIVFRDAMLSIPSIRMSLDGSVLVNQLCHLFPWNSNDTRVNGEETLIQMLTIGKKLEHLCDSSLEDRTRFSLVTESFREGNRERLRELFADVDDD
ncbi:hypothetical protein BDR26DRAFT_1007731 [Obelidium mucronatum]|nr:hypothetical protein BDR26DRAFT_1007731 [Obelidium mucronatum]